MEPSLNIAETATSLSTSEVDKILTRNLFNSEGILGDEGPRDENDSTHLVKSDLPLKPLGAIYGGTPFSGLATVE